MARQSTKLSGCRGRATITTWPGNGFWTWHGKAVQWRWLLLDEISMVSAEMLARLEARCRQLVLDISATKYSKHTPTSVAPFGGLNVILSGDLWQLPPPRGTFLGQIPWHLVTGVPSKKLPLSLQGQQLVWLSSVQGGLQGVTELTRCERTQDVWLQELQGELRVGRLSEDNHAFLHGQPTRVPGSWCARTQQPTCGENICYHLYKNGSTPAAILKYECAGCRAERESKRLVAVAPDDPRFAESFSLARGIFHTNGGEVPRKQTSRGTMGATAWAGHLLCSSYGQSLGTSVAREARHRPR